MAKRGRHSILTTELTNTICALLSEGHYVVTVCSYVGIHESTYYDWLSQARQYDEMDESDFELMSVDDNLKRQRLTQFAESVEKAQGQAEIVALRAISADPSWQAKAWYLERSKPHRWGRRTQLTGPYDAEGKPTAIAIDPRAAVLGFLGELGDQLEADGIKETDQAKGNDDGEPETR
jgi:transposase-like protein